MQHYADNEPYEREPLDPATSRRSYHEAPSSRRPVPNSYAQPPPPPPPADEPPYYDNAHYHQDHRDHSPASSSPSRGHGQRYESPRQDPAAPPPPRHGDYSYRRNSRHEQQQQQQQHQQQQPYHPSYDLATPDVHYSSDDISLNNLDNYSQSVSRDNGSGSLAYHSPRRASREVYTDEYNQGNRIPPPPSRLQHNRNSRGSNSPRNSNYYPPIAGSPAGHHRLDRDSRSSLNPFGAAASSASSLSIARSGPASMADPYGEEAYRSYASLPRHDDNLGVVNPADIEDDGDDGLHYGRGSRSASRTASRTASRQGARAGIGAAAAIGAAAGGRAGPSAMNRGIFARDMSPDGRRDSWNEKPPRSKKWKWAIIVLGFVIVVGAIVGGVVGSVIAGRKNSGSDAGFNDDSKGDLTANSAEIKSLLATKGLYRVFPGVDYTPMNTQYPDCTKAAPSQNNVTRDVAILSRLTNTIRLYGTDCNQTEMVIHSIKQLGLEKDMKIWMGVWQDNDAKTNKRQLAQMWDILDKYGADPFKGIIVANEILFRKQMTISQLSTLMTSVRTNLTAKGMSLPVATSDLGDDWDATLAASSDYVMANVHPFFSGTEASKSAAWTLDFWNSHNAILLKDKSKGIIAETGWPTKGGHSCGEATTCDPGAVAGIDELNRFMADWVCQSLENNLNYFWFTAFDEPWKVRFNEPGKEWEDQWGILDVNRNLKKGVKIPDCGGKTV